MSDIHFLVPTLHILYTQKVFLPMSEVIPCGPPIVLHHSPEGQSLTQRLRQSWCGANTHTHTHAIGVLLILSPLSPCLLIGGCHWPRSPQKQEESHTLNQKAFTYTCALIPTYTMHTCPKHNYTLIAAYLYAHICPVHTTCACMCTQNRYVCVLHNHICTTEHPHSTMLVCIYSTYSYAYIHTRACA